MAETYGKAEGSILQRILFWCIDILMIAGIALFFVTGFGAHKTVVGSSMSPVLNAGDQVLLNRFSVRMDMIRRGDIILFYDESTNRENMKRVAGLPGETIQIHDGSLWVDGVKTNLTEFEKSEEGQVISFGGVASDPITLGTDEYFVLSDAGGSSEDSRFANIGNIKYSRIIGIVWSRIAPLEKATIFSRS